MNKKPYALQLAAKQRLRKQYGGIAEHVLRRVHEAAAKKKGQAITGMIESLESRLETAVFRMNMAPSMKSARQLVTHRKVKVNGRTVTAPSYELKVGDEIELQDKMAETMQQIMSATEAPQDVPCYFEVIKPGRKGKYIGQPKLEDVPYSETVEPNLVIEFYAR